MKFIDTRGVTWTENADGTLNSHASTGEHRKYVERHYGPLRPLPPNDPGDKIIQLPEPKPIEFEHWYRPGEPLVKCSECGALVTTYETTKHEVWHLKIQTGFTNVAAALTVLDNHVGEVKASVAYLSGQAG